MYEIYFFLEFYANICDITHFHTHLRDLGGEISQKQVIYKVNYKVIYKVSELQSELPSELPSELQSK
jgi:hypothetical protein